VLRSTAVPEQIGLVHCVQRHARVLYVEVVCVGEGLRGGALHGVFPRGRSRGGGGGGGCGCGVVGEVVVVVVVLDGGGGLGAVRQDGRSAMHWGR
jgi:hypothetical protein